MTTVTGEHRPAPPRSTANPAPLRRPGSVRRTTSIDIEWVDGLQGPRRLHGRVRDALTPAAQATDRLPTPRLLDEARMEAMLDFERTITAIAADPAPQRLGELVGQRGGGHLRVMLREIMPEEIARGAPLYLVLDDISGTSLVSHWAWSLWNPDWMHEVERAIPASQLAKMQDRAGVCWGLQIGNSGLDPNGRQLIGRPADAGNLVNVADPEGWHAFPALAGVSMRRARRIDLWREADGTIRIDAAFQDSAPRPPAAGGGRAALHEYRLTATVDPDSHRLLSLNPEARVLPFHECPGAVANARKLVGTPLAHIREAVLSELRGPAGCTHLNDALRALAEVPILAAHLPAG